MEDNLYSAERESIILDAFGKTPELRLIDFFMDNPMFDFSRREIIEVLGMNKRTLYRVLPKLEEAGVVKVSRKIGKAKLYRINKDSPVVACLRNIERELSLQEAEKAAFKEEELAEIPASENEKSKILVST